MLTGNKAGGQTQLCKENLPRQGENAASGRVGATGRRAGCCWKEGRVLPRPTTTRVVRELARSDAAAHAEVSRVALG